MLAVGAAHLGGGSLLGCDLYKKILHLGQERQNYIAHRIADTHGGRSIHYIHRGGPQVDIRAQLFGNVTLDHVDQSPDVVLGLLLLGINLVGLDLCNCLIHCSIVLFRVFHVQIDMCLYQCGLCQSRVPDYSLFGQIFCQLVEYSAVGKIITVVQRTDV